MPYKTIQQNFANGELNPRMQGRADTEIYYKSAQKMRDVVTTPFGGYVRRPAMQKIEFLGQTTSRVSNWNASTQLSDTSSTIDNINDDDKKTYFCSSSVVGTTRSQLISIRGTSNPIKKVTLFKASLLAEQATASCLITSSKLEILNFQYPYTQNKYLCISSPKNLSAYLYHNITIGYKKDAAPCEIIEHTLFLQSHSDYPYSNSVYLTEDNFPTGYTPLYIVDPAGTTSILVNVTNGGLGYREAPKITIAGDGTGAVGTASISAGKVVGITVIGAVGYTTATVTISKPPQDYADIFKIQGVDSNGQFEDIGVSFKLDCQEEKTIYFDLDKKFSSITLARVGEGMLLCGLRVAEFTSFTYNTNTDYREVKLWPFVFNNDQSYLFSMLKNTIKIIRNDTIVKEIATTYTDENIKNIRYAQTADTAIFVEKDIIPYQLKRGSSDDNWIFSGYPLISIPKYNYNITAPITFDFAITPNALDGVVKLVFEDRGTIVGNVVGQYLEGNGGRVKITGQTSTYLTGYTIIGFYTADAIAAGDWNVTKDYEDVWSAKRGWPTSITFHGGRLWFGGSRSRPQTVWGSKVGLFGKFEATSGYNADAIEFTLDTDTLNRITDIYSQRNLQIFTLSGEFICQTSYNEPITPDNVNATKQTSNGSWTLTSPIDIEGVVIFVERRGQALMNFLYSSDQNAYASSNNSLINSHLINSPQDLDVERNNYTQQTNYVYIVNHDGSLCVVNLQFAQGITGGFTLWKTEGKIKSVCVLPDATYLAVERSEMYSNKIYLERLEWDNLTDNAEIIEANGQSTFTIERFANRTVDVLLDGKVVGQYTANSDGVIKVGTALIGQVEIGLPFRSYVESNILEVPQLGNGVGKKKRLATMTVRTIDTPELTVNGETQKLNGAGIEDITFYGIGDWSEKPTWEMTQNNPYHFNVLAVQMNVNYEVANDQY